MKIKYTVNKIDMFVGHLIGQFYLKIFWGLFLVFVCINAFIARGDGGDYLHKISFFIVSTVAIAILQIAVLVIMSIYQSFIHDNLGIIGDHTLEIKSGKLIETTSQNCTEFSNLNQLSVSSHGRYVFLWINRSKTRFFLININRIQDGNISAFLSMIKDPDIENVAQQGDAPGSPSAPP